MADLRPYLWHTNNTQFHDWFERDRQHVRLEDSSGREIISLWDEEVSDFVRDGFKTTRQSWHDALCEYATANKIRARRRG
jgi:hypothetical protein